MTTALSRALRTAIADGAPAILWAATDRSPTVLGGGWEATVGWRFIAA